MPEAEYTPAAGRFLPTSAYDRLLTLLTREAKWRAALPWPLRGHWIRLQAGFRYSTQPERLDDLVRAADHVPT